MSFWSRASLGTWAVGVAWCGASALGCSAGGGDAGATSGGSASSAAGSGGTTAGTGGTTAGGGGVVGGGGTNAAGGSSGAGTGGTGGAGMGGGGAGGGTSGAGGTSGGGGVLCPTDATFCSSFEDSAMPAKAVYKYNAAPGEWTRDFEVDTMVFHGGKSSLRVKSGEAGASGAYQMLAVPAPMATFWVRLYIQQTEVDIGGDKHNVFGGAASTDEPNSPGMIEFAEDVGVAFNTSDDVRWPTGFGRINGTPMPFTLAKGMWHCIEIHYDSATRAQQLFVNGVLKIDASDYPKAGGDPVKIFKFGFNGLNGPPRKVWFDDVAVGPTRAGCL